MRGKLYLIPSTIGAESASSVIPSGIIEIIRTIKYFIVEKPRSARRFLIQLGIKPPFDNITFFTLDKHTRQDEIPTFLEPVSEANIGLVSEAGVPCVADPGAEIVRLAHSRNISVIPLVGPSSILLALMASGLNGQNFAFTGYLPIQRNKRVNKIKQLEKRSYDENQSQVFIETPYRNNQLFNDILISCSQDTLLCIATNITMADEQIRTLTIREWKKIKVDINKKPTVFILMKP
ncbi:MAG: SAM-dependent methyltransferase [Bacteroidales bacterium]|nr:MAG: SAM-dependent methyltransferase [Bacteroidales bacterium]